MRSPSDITSIIGCQVDAADLQVYRPDSLTDLHKTGDAYAEHMVRTLLAIRELHGLDATSRASVRMCARMARRLALDELLEMVDAGVDGPDRVLLCDAAVWLDALVAAPESWSVDR